MSRPFSLQTHPQRLLLQLDWLLLGVIGLGIFLAPPIYLSPKPSWVLLVGVLAFGLMGVCTPPKRLFYQVIYTGAEFIIIWIPILLNENRIQAIPSGSKDP